MGHSDRNILMTRRRSLFRYLFFFVFFISFDRRDARGTHSDIFFSFVHSGDVMLDEETSRRSGQGNHAVLSRLLNMALGALR